MDEETEILDEVEQSPGVGERLRAAREERGMSLEDVAEYTRITQRHLAMIEEGQLGSLPGRTYAIGFSKSFAKAVGLDEQEIADRVREELALIDPYGEGLAPRSFEPGDPARVPSAGLAWLSALAALLLFAGGSFFIWNTYFAPAVDLPSLVSAEEEQPKSDPASSVGGEVLALTDRDPEGAVVFTALEQIWVRFYERGGPVLLEKEMLPGESFAVPVEAADPKLITARPDALAITIGGQEVPKLAEEQDMMDVPVSAQALLDRAAPGEPAASPTI